jgi:uncharacterized protein (DUF58 family)
MSTPGTALAEANDRRHRATLSAAQNAIARLQRHGAVVTFGSVAKEAGVSRAWLNREPNIRDLICRARSTGDRPIAVHSPQRASADSLSQMTDALRAELIRLKQENHDLREQLARKLGEQRAQSTRRRRPLGGDMSTPSTPPTTTGSSH